MSERPKDESAVEPSREAQLDDIRAEKRAVRRSKAKRRVKLKRLRELRQQARAINEQARAKGKDPTPRRRKAGTKGGRVLPFADLVTQAKIEVLRQAEADIPGEEKRENAVDGLIGWLDHKIRGGLVAELVSDLALRYLLRPLLAGLVHWAYESLMAWLDGLDEPEEPEEE